MKKKKTIADEREYACRKCVYNDTARCGVPFCTLPRCINERVKRREDEYCAEG